MRSFTLVLLYAGLSAAFPHARDKGPPLDSNASNNRATCPQTGTVFDYVAKSRQDVDDPICPIGVTDVNLLFSRQGFAPPVDDYTCAPDRPCSNGACCPKKTLSCNYGEEYCGTTDTSPNDKCWSSCQAKAECGENANPPGKKCPLNVCCSRWGFCGMTKEFCDKGTKKKPGCQSNCNQPGPKDKASDPSDRIIGYYEAWRHDVSCQGMSMDQIPVNSLTHLFFSFGSITPGDFNIAGMDALPFELFSKFTALKKKNPGLKVVIALGGWTFNDPGPTQKIFSNMASTKESRAKFIENLFSFMRQYAFDGVDFDWEYPGAKDRGGVDKDGKNFVQFLKELDEANKKQPIKYIVCFTAPSSYWYLRHFDLKAVNYVDFINVMSYDLHGVWDSDNPIGSHIYGHTNLTETDLAFDLFWRNNVPAKKLNMGLGFYGRSFQLQDPKCNKPGCVFKGGAEKGGCSGESGILTYREIQAIIKKDDLKPFHDKKAGVKYINYRTDQWVSFDDKETFDQKKKFAKELGLGGFLIWAIDQDDDELSALQAVLSPKKLGEFKDSAKDKSYYDDASIPNCYITKCDGNCDAGFVKITDQRCGEDDKKSKLCCPLSGAPNPDECTWRGSAPDCNGHCNDDEVMLQMNKWGDGKHCNDGRKAFCCKSPLAQGNQCYWAGMGKNCNGKDKTMTFSGTVLSEAAKIGQAIIDLVGKPTPLHELAGDALDDLLDLIEVETMKKYCCPEEDAKKWTKCKWHGKPGSCFDNHCDEISGVQLTDSYFGEGETCGWRWERVRVFCCEPVEGEEMFLPVPLENLFQNPPEGDNVDTEFTLDVDDRDKDDNPSDASFQFVVLTSPEEIQISIDKRDGSHWDVFGCNDAATEGEQTVQMVCTDLSDDSNCHRIDLGHGVPGTILQMPNGCGPGKYAVAKSMEPAKHQLLPRHLSHLGSRGVVYDLTFDYDFLRVPRDLGNTQMRVDFSNQDNYWDEVVKATASKKRKKRSLEDVGGNHVRWLEEEFRDDYHFGALDKRELQERWFATDIIDWLTRMIKPEIKREFTHEVDETFTAKIVDEKWSCMKNNVGYEGHVSAIALVNMKVATSFGFTLIITKLTPPIDMSQSYLTFYNKGKITATLTLEAVAKVFYSKEKTIITFPFPGASFRIPGIATIGPNIRVSGSIDASVELAGTIETKIDIASWEVRQLVPDGDSKEMKPKEIGSGDPNLDKTGDFSGLQKPEFYAGVSVEGDITVKLKAAAEFGIRFDDKYDVGAAAAGVVGEGSIMVKMGAGINTQAECPFTYGLQVGARLYAQAEAPKKFKWPGARYDIVGWEKDIIEGGTCPDLGGMPTKRSTVLGLPWGEQSDNNTSDFVQYQSLMRRRTEDVERHSLQKRAAVYGPAFSIPVGEYFCPSDEKGENEGTDCESVKPAWDDDKYLTDEDDYSGLVTRDLGELDETGDILNTFEKRDAPKKSILCSIKIRSYYPTGGDLPNAAAYGYEKPLVCRSYDFGAPLPARVASVQYDTEHILEYQLPGMFLKHLDLTLGKGFEHPDPNKKDKQGNREKVTFCTYFDLLWEIPSVGVGGQTRTPAQHISDCYPTRHSNANELVVLEHVINIPAKGKAWGSESRIVNTDKWNNKVSQDIGSARSILKTLRISIGSLKYHSDPTIAAHLKAQKERVGAMFAALETILPNNPPTVNGVKYTAWKSQSLQTKWNQFMNRKYILASSKTKKPVAEGLPSLKKVWTNDAKRKESDDKPGDKPDVKKNKQQLRDLIEDIDALDAEWTALPQWVNPF